MSSLSSRAEVIKLAHLLAVTPAQLDFLAELPSVGLHHFRVAVSDHLFDEQRELMAALAVWSRWLPALVAALVARRWLGTRITARLASELPAWRVAAIARYLPLEFMADIALRLDPRGARELLYLLPEKHIAGITQILLARRDFITLGRFVALLPDAVVADLAATIVDEGDLVEIVFFIEARHRIDHLIRILPRERIVRAILMVCDDHRRHLWPKLLALVANSGYSLKRELGDLVAAQGDLVLAAILQVAQAENLWEDILPVVSCLSPEVQRQVVNLPLLQEPAVLQRIVIATDRKGLWTDMLALVEHMNEAGREALAAVLEDADDAVLAHAVYAALLRAQWATILDIVRRLTPARQQQCLHSLSHYLGALDPETVAQLQAFLQHYGIAEHELVHTA